MHVYEVNPEMSSSSERVYLNLLKFEYVIV